MTLIKLKKKMYQVNDQLRGYLRRHGRYVTLPVDFEALGRYTETIDLYDKNGQDTLWQTCLYPPAEREEIERMLVQTYADLKVMGRIRLMKHLVTDRVDVCTWGNPRPFRVRIVNRINDNFDYFYVKRADASRIYGLELEHLLSPNRIQFLSDGDTVVEEHIAGLPGDEFLRNQLSREHISEIRIAKEFLKFNARCFVRFRRDSLPDSGHRF